MRLFLEDPYPLLEKYIDYYFTGLENASPLIPEWVPIFLSSGPHDIRENLLNRAVDPHTKLYNEYALWMVREDSFPHIETAFTEWKALAESFYTPFFQSWLKSKGAKYGEE